MSGYKFKNVSSIRSKTMKAVRSKNTSIELLLRKALFKKGLRYRIHYKKLPGKPDVVFVKKKVAIFCDSEFWHGKDWELNKNKIKSNREYWFPKIEKNIERDKKNNKLLEDMGWTVLRYWEEDIRKNLSNIVKSISEQLDLET